MLCATLGITVDVENLDKQENVQVYVSNHVTPFDQLVVHLQTGSVTVNRSLLLKMSVRNSIYFAFSQGKTFSILFSLLPLEYASLD